MPFTNREVAAIQDFIQTCQAIKAATEITPAKPASHLPHPPAPFPFPPIPNLSPQLRALGISERFVSTLVEFFRTKCEQLQCATERIFHGRDLSLMYSEGGSVVLPDAVRTCVLKLYNQNVEHFQSEILRRAKIQCDQLRASAIPTHPKPTKATFNHDYVPVLEKYFEYNAYPSAADRALMARKSLMTERQIEVWFQNHRNRARRDGKPLARLQASDHLPVDVSFDSLDATMGDLIRPESERLMMEQEEDEDEDSDGIEALALSLNVSSSSRASSVDSDLGTPASQPISARDALNPSTPPFAYPAPYVPQLRTFFGATFRPAAFTFPKPTWARQPSATRSDVTSTRIPRREVDAFAELFARLNVRENAKKQGRRRIAVLPQSRNSPVPQPSYASPAATRAITTILCPGRHPAFVPSVVPRATRRVRNSPSPPPPYESWMSSPGAGPSKPSTSTSSTSTTAFTFQSPPRYSQSAAPTSPPVNALPKASTPTPRRRKSPQLPRRVPGSPPVARPYSQTQKQTTSHPAPQRTPRPSHHPYASPSRASSSASSSSSHRVSSSSSSNASSSTPTTPNGSTMSLPMSYPINTPKNTKPTSPIFTAQNIADIFGDAAAFTTPSSQGFSAFGTAGFDSPDFGRMPMGNMFDFNFNTPHGRSIVQARS